MIVEKIKSLLQQKFQEEGFEDCYLVEINTLPNNKVEVFVDSDSGINFVKCRSISRFLENEIDEKGWLGEKYTLDVSSPGIGRPLKFARQYAKNVGRKLEVKKLSGGSQTGILISVADTAIILEEKTRVKEGKKKVNKIIQTEIPFEDIKQAIVKITF